MEQAFGGVLRHINLSGPDLHDDNDPRPLRVLTDDERPGVYHGHQERSAGQQPEPEKQSDAGPSAAAFQL